MKRIRAGMGLGDSLYLQSVVRHLAENGEDLEVCTNWPDVFRYLPVKTAPFSKARIQIIAHYTARKAIQGTSQFEDCCMAAGIHGDVDLRLDWEVVNQELVETVCDRDLPVVLVQLPRNPMGRTDGFGKELLPDCRVIQKAINAIKDDAYIVQVGSGDPLFEFKNIDLDLANKTSVSDLIDLASMADKMIGYCSFMVPLAESFDKPALFVWSSKGLQAQHGFIRRITPEKILHKSTSYSLVDTAKGQKAVIDEFGTAPSS